MEFCENGKTRKTLLVVTSELESDGKEHVYWQFPDTEENYFLIGVLEDIKLSLLDNIKHVEE